MKQQFPPFKLNKMGNGIELKYNITAASFSMGVVESHMYSCDVQNIHIKEVAHFLNDKKEN